MPDVLVEIRGNWLGARKRDYLEAVRQAIVEALQTPVEDQVLRLIEHAPENFLIPQNAGGKLTRIEIAMFAGRSPQAKRALYQSLIAHLEAFDVPAADVKVVLIEVPTLNVAIRGGLPAAELDLGYTVQV